VGQRPRQGAKRAEEDRAEGVEGGGWLIKEPPVRPPPGFSGRRR
jgi:hypothetical protein